MDRQLEGNRTDDLLKRAARLIFAHQQSGVGGELIEVFFETTYQVEHVSARLSSEWESGEELRLGANLLYSDRAGKKRQRVLHRYQLDDLIGRQLIDKIIDNVKNEDKENWRERPEIRGTFSARDIRFERYATIARRQGETCSNTHGRRLEVDFFDCDHAVMGRFFDQRFVLDYDEINKVLRDRAKRYQDTARVGFHKTPVVFHGATSAVLLHELIGHPLEEDNYRIAKTWVNQISDGDRKMPEGLVFYDDPTIENSYGSFEFDDKGVKAEPHIMYRDGVFFPMGERGECGETGHMRRQDYRYPAIPRASNAVVGQGRDCLDRITEVGSSGLLHVYSLGAGRIDIQTGSFSYSAPEAIWIDGDGRETRLLDVVLLGHAAHLFSSIEAIADDCELINATCGKQGQFIPMGACGSSIRVSEIQWCN